MTDLQAMSHVLREMRDGNKKLMEQPDYVRLAYVVDRALIIKESANASPKEAPDH